MKTTFPLTTLLVAIAATAYGATLDVRQPDATARMHFELGRAYEPCLAPNTVSQQGVPACAPPVTSVCKPDRVTLDIESTRSNSAPLVRYEFSSFPFGTTTQCREGTYVFEFTVRRTSNDGVEDPEDRQCASGTCTFEDRVFSEPVTRTQAGARFFALGIVDTGFDPSFEIIRVVMIGPDGLPVASSGVSNLDSAAVANLGVAYPACTDPEPDGAGDTCSAGPWTSPCDFESGELAWSIPSAIEQPTVHATLRNVSGTSPLCTAGTYAVEATVRETRACGQPAVAVDCTLVDQTVTVPLVANGRGLDATAALPKDGVHRSTEILASRLLDPTGAPLAAPGVTGVDPLEGLRVTIKGDTLSLKGIITVSLGEFAIDPTTEYGFTIHVSDNDGPVYGVTIPGLLWQLQLPLGQHWTYVDKGGVLNGIRKVRLKRTSKVGRGDHGYKLDLRVAGVDLSAANLPGLTVRTDVVTVFSLASFRSNAQGHRTCKVGRNKLTCK